jgi:hypothetical protein
VENWGGGRFGSLGLCVWISGVGFVLGVDGVAFDFSGKFAF